MAPIIRFVDGGDYVTGYHGTCAENSAGIERSGFLPSTGEQNYLGDGVYFFTQSLLAERWAVEKCGVENAVVYRAIILQGLCLDLYNPEHIEVLDYFAKIVRDRVSKWPEKKRPKVNDATVINFFATLEKFDCVKGCYVNMDLGKVFNESRFLRYQRPMICVRTLKNITKVTRQ